MPMFRPTSPLGFCTCLPLIVVVGCGKPAPAPVTATPLPMVAEAIQEKSQSLATAARSASIQADPLQKQHSKAHSNKPTEVSDKAVESFKSPFKNRADIFVPPQRVQQAVRQNNDTNNTVALQGFVQVDQLQVVLNIDGTIAPMKEGEKKYGIHVLSIEPPKVVLQRGRERWTATLDH